MSPKANNEPGISFDPMACRVFQNCHQSNALNVPDFLPDGMYDKMGDIKCIGFSVDSCALSLKMTFSGFHRSVADAVQRGLDSENLRILGTVLIPMDILPSIARVSEADYGKFMGMAKEDIVSRIDGGCGIDVILATSGRRRRVVFWKVQPKARLGIFIPSYEAFLVTC